jgi:signal transduction histidine kinase
MNPACPAATTVPPGMPAVRPKPESGSTPPGRGVHDAGRMNPTGQLNSRPPARVRTLVALSFAWLAFLFALGGWWVFHMNQQAGRIADLERKAGIASLEASQQWARTQRMLHWEGATFFGALSVSLLLLGWLYWRDSRRARSLHGFFASVTHELRTPLTGLRLEAESLAELTAAESPSRALVERLLDDTTRIESQVERALELARVEGAGPVPTQPLSLARVVSQFLRQWRAPLAPAVVLENRVIEAALLADPAAVQIILRNLLENSIRHCQRERVMITLASTATSNGVTLTVTDDGEPAAGLPRQLGRLFEKGSASKGAGVGLYLVRSLMQRMGGRAKFHPAQGGTNPRGFHVELHFRTEVADG